MEIDKLYARVFAMKNQARQKISREFRANVRKDPFKGESSASFIILTLPHGFTKL